METEVLTFFHNLLILLKLGKATKSHGRYLKN